MSKTPITDEKQFDSLPYFFNGRVFAHKVVMADDMRKLETELAEARAEIERLKAEVDRWRKESLSKDDARLNLRSAADSIKYWTKQAFDKDKLIEQMREALKNECLNHCEERFSRDCPPNDCRDCKIKAALEAAERSGK